MRVAWKMPEEISPRAFLRLRIYPCRSSSRCCGIKTRAVIDSIKKEVYNISVKKGGGSAAFLTGYK